MPAKDQVKAEIEQRFTFHPATGETGPKHDAVRSDLKRLALKWHKELPDGRQKSIALSKLEEAMWAANSAIAIGTQAGGVPSGTAPAAQPSEPAKPRRGKKATAVEGQTTVDEQISEAAPKVTSIRKNAAKKTSGTKVHRRGRSRA